MNISSLSVTFFIFVKNNKGAPLRRNDQIAAYADEVLAFWDGRSRGTLYTIRQFRKRDKQVHVVLLSKENV